MYKRHILIHAAIILYGAFLNDLQKKRVLDRVVIHLITSYNYIEHETRPKNVRIDANTFFNHSTQHKQMDILELLPAYGYLVIYLYIYLAFFADMFF